MERHCTCWDGAQVVTGSDIIEAHADLSIQSATSHRIIPESNCSNFRIFIQENALKISVHSITLSSEKLDYSRCTSAPGFMLWKIYHVDINLCALIIYSWSVKQPLKLTHWGRVTHICVGDLTTIGSDNGLSPDRRQAIIWTNAGILSSGPLGINFSEISMKIQTFSFRKMRLKSSSAKWRPSCLGLNVLSMWWVITFHRQTIDLDNRPCPHLNQSS